MLYAHEWNIYDGDPATISDLEPTLKKFVLSYTTPPLEKEGKKERSQFEKGIGCALLIALILLIFTIWFVISLLPVALRRVDLYNSFTYPLLYLS